MCDTARQVPLSEDDLVELEAVIGYRFRDRSLLQQAFTRDSYTNEHGGRNNQVLEFIGDTALEMVVVRGMDNAIRKAEMTGHPLNVSEGILTDIKKDLVKDEYLAGIARKLGIHTYQVVGGNYSNAYQWDTDKICGSLIEAILGAVVIDSNWSITALNTVCRTMFGRSWLSSKMKGLR